eukprot:2465172-Heterocapsa_arctica.AAC.1
MAREVSRSAGALAAAIAFRRLVERQAAARGRKHAQLAGADVGRGADHDVGGRVHGGQAPGAAHG